MNILHLCLASVHPLSLKSCGHSAINKTVQACTQGYKLKRLERVRLLYSVSLHGLLSIYIAPQTIAMGRSSANYQGYSTATIAPDSSPIVNSSPNSTTCSNTLNPDYISGLVQSDGSFFVTISKNNILNLA